MRSPLASAERLLLLIPAPQRRLPVVLAAARVLQGRVRRQAKEQPQLLPRIIRRLPAVLFTRRLRVHSSQPSA